MRRMKTKDIHVNPSLVKSNIHNEPLVELGFPSSKLRDSKSVNEIFRWPTLNDPYLNFDQNSVQKSILHSAMWNELAFSSNCVPFELQTRDPTKLKPIFLIVHNDELLNRILIDPCAKCSCTSCPRPMKEDFRILLRRINLINNRAV